MALAILRAILQPEALEPRVCRASQSLCLIFPSNSPLLHLPGPVEVLDIPHTLNQVRSGKGILPTGLLQTILLPLTELLPRERKVPANKRLCDGLATR